MKDAKALQLVARIKSDLIVAMKEQNQTAVSTLKSLLASFSNAEAVEIAPSNTSTEVPRKDLDESDLTKIIQAELDELHQVIIKLDEQSEYRMKLEEKQAILERYR